MDKKKLTRLLDLSDANDGYVSVSEAKGLGIAQTYLCSLEEDGLFKKVSKGLYLKKGYARDVFYETSFRYRRAVFSFPSTLFLHGLVEEEHLSVNLPLNYLTQGIEGIACRHVGEKEYGLGQALVVTPRGNLVSSYDLERTMVDLVRHHEDFEINTFISIWRKAKEKSPYLEKLLAYAREFHVDGEIRLLLRLY